ncbi:hypothetical protein D9757_006752 [Collybiopsis confluens]|uniref:Uncharacterized protein n=1 Tax=Collybiopsis confluens TaxID=2823264 RepID=A0A8H5HLB3_9AGAR|nr:hypothetical protein D9757_006752 [Collybiopsis confluens]
MLSSTDVLEEKFRNDVYLHLVAATILYYDHLLTFGTDLCRLQKLTANIMHLQILNYFFSGSDPETPAATCSSSIDISRFLATLECSCPSSSPRFRSRILSLSSCSAWNIFQELFHALVGLIVAVLLTMRVYALYDCNKRLLIFLTGLMLVGIGSSVAADMLASSTKIPPSIPNTGCHDLLDLKNAAVVVIGWEMLFLYDSLLFILTLRKAHQAWRLTPGLQYFRGTSLFAVVVRDGTIYFAIMALCNLMNVVAFYVSGIDSSTPSCFFFNLELLVRGTHVAPHVTSS